MIRINCPFCGERDHSEFSYGKDATIQYPPLDGAMEDWVKAVFERENLDGVVFETWHHNNGCRMWIIVERDTTTHEIHSVRPAHVGWAQALSVGGKVVKQTAKKKASKKTVTKKKTSKKKVSKKTAAKKTTAKKKTARKKTAKKTTKKTAKKSVDKKS